eukprot:CAMPEP_0196782240 /NCGR_PEP_ID=MMETSP1104-20130614/11114_1 /TAXON_ID=33652 /ORGANISM="Cafeteria sp., Strain Caron Lab Isolate" /LENGTH=506 /DNA_ID=CAMNT_0042152471 /DNA_START=28 /DNA_END=1544 /DNA_ORIENTATION=-
MALLRFAALVVVLAASCAFASQPPAMRGLMKQLAMIEAQEQTISDRLSDLSDSRAKHVVRRAVNDMLDKADEEDRAAITSAAVSSVETALGVGGGAGAGDAMRFKAVEARLEPAESHEAGVGGSSKELKFAESGASLSEEPNDGIRTIARTVARGSTVSGSLPQGEPSDPPFGSGNGFGDAVEPAADGSEDEEAGSEEEEATARFAAIKDAVQTASSAMREDDGSSGSAADKVVGALERIDEKLDSLPKALRRNTESAAAKAARSATEEAEEELDEEIAGGEGGKGGRKGKRHRARLEKMAEILKRIEGKLDSLHDSASTSGGGAAAGDKAAVDKASDQTNPVADEAEEHLSVEEEVERELQSQGEGESQDDLEVESKAEAEQLQHDAEFVAQQEEEAAQEMQEAEAQMKEAEAMTKKAEAEVEEQERKNQIIKEDNAKVLRQATSLGSDRAASQAAAAADVRGRDAGRVEASQGRGGEAEAAAAAPRFVAPMRVSDRSWVSAGAQ